MRVIDDRHTAVEGPITAGEVAALDTLIKEVAEVSGVEARKLKRRLLSYLRIADLTELPVSRYAQTTALLEDKRDRATLDPATYRLKPCWPFSSGPRNTNQIGKKGRHVALPRRPSNANGGL